MHVIASGGPRDDSGVKYEVIGAMMDVTNPSARMEREADVIGFWESVFCCLPYLSRRAFSPKASFSQMTSA